jgi:hypothetical protein
MINLFLRHGKPHKKALSNLFLRRGKTHKKALSNLFLRRGKPHKKALSNLSNSRESLARPIEDFHTGIAQYIPKCLKRTYLKLLGWHDDSRNPLKHVYS